MANRTILKHALGAATPVTLALLSLALLISACSSKGVEGICSDGAVCGGSPLGVWNTVGSCDFKVYRSDQPLSPDEQVAQPILPLLTSSPVAPTTVGDQCSQLIYTANMKIKTVNLWHDAPELLNGQISYNPDNTYALSLKFGGYNISHFSPFCLQSSGGNPSCAVLVTALTQYYDDEAGTDASGAKVPDFANINCVDASGGGCDCGYDYQVTLTDKGVWHAADRVVTQSSDPSAYSLNGRPAGSQGPTTVMASSVCLQDTRLTLSGYGGGPLFHAPGLRVLTLQKQ